VVYLWCIFGSALLRPIGCVCVRGRRNWGLIEEGQGSGGEGEQSDGGFFFPIVFQLRCIFGGVCDLPGSGCVLVGFCQIYLAG
jgi:hypothetical protein